MRYHGLLNAALIALLVLIAAGFIRNALNKRRRQREWEERQRKKGEEGELAAASFLSRIRGYKKIIHHVYVPKEGEKGTSEIDLVMVHEKGIFVIENKNYGGAIYGREEDLYWLQVFGRGEKRSFYNPMKQNQSHIRHLKRLLAAYAPWELPCVSVITFNSRAKLKRISVDTEHAVVASVKKVRRRLRKRMRRMPRVLSRGQVDEICFFLEEKAGNTNRNRKNHEKQVKKTVKSMRKKKF